MQNMQTRKPFSGVLVATLFMTTISVGAWHFSPMHLPEIDPIETAESLRILREVQQLEKAYRAADQDYKEKKSRYGKDTPQTQEAAFKLHAVLKAYQEKMLEYNHLH